MIKKLISQVNFAFFSRTFLAPFGVAFFGILLILLFVVVPFVTLDVGYVMSSPVVPQYLKSAAGFEEFSFSELGRTGVLGLNITTESAEIIRDIPMTFSLSIPKLKIKDALVETNSSNLDPTKLLGHYKGTALPGQTGNALIYGHSVLPIFYNPKNYKTIFSTLPSLESGDEITVAFAGYKYKYKVIKKITQKPSDVDVFDPNPAGLSVRSSTITLLTCVPPGSKTYRLSVVALKTGEGEKL